MRLTIERLRTLVVIAGVLLLTALGVFLGSAKYRHPINIKELPKRLGIDIQQEANGVTYSHSLGAHSQYKIHASKEVQLKEGMVQLHDVKIELYGEDGSRVDRIEGNEFEYDPKSGKATAAGPVEITLMRPGVAPAIAPKAIPDAGLAEKVKIKPLATAAETAAAGEIHVKTSGLVFDWHSGITTTSQHVDFSLMQGAGSSMGATYDSQQGVLVLDRAVELTTTRSGDTVEIHASHAVFERENVECRMQTVTAEYRGGQATANEAKILFRADGSASRLDMTNGFTLATATGGHMAAPTGRMDFDEHNQPQHGHLEGGVRMDAVSGDRQMHGSSPTAELEFTQQGELKLAHLERGVEMRSEQTSQTAAKAGAAAGLLRVSRTWRSPVADVAFRDAGHGKVTPTSIHGMGGVVIAGESQRGKAAPTPSRLAADDVTGTFGADSALTAMTGVGHASIEQTTATGETQTANGDRLDAHFEARAGAAGDARIQSAVLDGHVVLVQRPAAKSGAPAQAPMQATAGHAVYEGAGNWLHLTVSPRVTDGAMQLTAAKVDISQDSGDAFAHGDVKASWLDSDKPGQTNAQSGGKTGQQSTPLGGRGPAHAVADEAQINRNSDEATFKGHARLWQQANSIAGPVIVIDRGKRTLVSRSASASDPVRAVLLSAEGLQPDAVAKAQGARIGNPAVVRVRGGELDYFDAQRRAVIVGGSLGTVTAETGTATSVSNQVELFLAPAGQTAAKGSAEGQVDRMTATGHVVVTTDGRRGTGELLTYTGKTGDYVLTGTAAAPPRITDATRGNVTGEALIFNSRDDSVSIEGRGHTTRTETTVSRGSSKSEPRN